MRHRVITDPAYWRMKKRLAQALAEMNAIPPLGGSSWSAAARWTARQRKRLAERVDGLQSKLDAYRRKHGLDDPAEQWRSRPASRVDATIRRKFANCVSASF